MASELNEIKMTATVGGHPFELRLGALTGEQAQRFRAATGVGVMEALANPELDRFAALVWVVRGARESKLKYRDVLRTITMDDLATIDIDDGTGDDVDFETVTELPDPE